MPKLPVPLLETTLKKYEKTLGPLLNNTDLDRVKKIIEKFGASDGLGPKLQLYLLDRREKFDNWVSLYNFT